MARNTSTHIALPLLCLLLLTGMISTSQGLCFVYSDKALQCSVCYKSKLNPSTQKCEQQPESDPRLLYKHLFGSLNICVTCKEDYADQAAITGVKCIKDPSYIPNCFTELRIAGKTTCEACHGGIPAKDEKSCLPWSQVANPIANCKIGTTVQYVNNCVLCEDGKIWDERNNTCDRVPAGFTGCIDVKKIESGMLLCEACNVFEGYSMGLRGKCTKIQ